MYVQKIETMDQDDVTTEWTIVSRIPVDIEANPEDTLAMIRTTPEGSMEAMNFWGTIRLVLNPHTTDVVRAAELVELTEMLLGDCAA